MENTKKNKSRTSRLGKWKAMLVVALLCFNVGQAVCADWNQIFTTGGNYTLTSSGTGFKVNNGNTVYDNIGNITVSVPVGQAVTLTFDNTAPIYLNGVIKVTQGRLNLSKTNGSTNVTLKRKPSYKGTCILVNNETTNEANCYLYLGGNSNAPFIVDGACDDFSISYDATEDVYNASASTELKAEGPLVGVFGGTFDCYHTTFTNNWNSVGDGGAFRVSTNAYSRTIVTIRYSTFRTAMHTRLEPL